jgi:hypothetical protein
MNKNMTRQYQVTRNNGAEVTTVPVIAGEVEAIRPQDFDFYMSKPDATLGFQDHKGKWHEWSSSWPRLGPVCLDILEALQLNAGDYLTPTDLAEITGYESLRENGNLAARVCAIRHTLGNSGSRFIETRTAGGYAIRWPKNRTFVVVERVPSTKQA